MYRGQRQPAAAMGEQRTERGGPRNEGPRSPMRCCTAQGGYSEQPDPADPERSLAESKGGPGHAPSTLHRASLTPIILTPAKSPNFEPPPT